MQFAEITEQAGDDVFEDIVDLLTQTYKVDQGDARRLIYTYRGLSPEVRIEIEHVVFNLTVYQRYNTPEFTDPFLRPKHPPKARFFWREKAPASAELLKSNRIAALRALEAIGAITWSEEKVEIHNQKQFDLVLSAWLGFDTLVAGALQLRFQNQRGKHIAYIDGRIVECENDTELGTLSKPTIGSWSQKFWEYVWEHQDQVVTYDQLRKAMRYDSETSFRPQQWIRELGFEGEQEQYFSKPSNKTIRFIPTTQETLTKED